MMKSGGGSTVEYKGTLDCAMKIIQKEGIGGERETETKRQRDRAGEERER